MRQDMVRHVPPPDRRRRRALWSLLLSLLVLTPATAARGQSLEATVSVTGAALRRSWQQDPLSRSLAFPGIRLVSPEHGLQERCTEAETPAFRESTAIHCRAGDEVLVNQDLLRANLHGDKAWAVAYWISIGLAEALVSRTSDPVDAGPAAASLQATCLAATLMANAALQAPSSTQARLQPAMEAYPLSSARRKGTGLQRGYAFLTGLGATESSCSRADMLALASSRVPDPSVLAALADLRRQGERGNTSLLAVLSSQCRPTPKAPCPRRLLRDPQAGRSGSGQR